MRLILPLSLLLGTLAAGCALFSTRFESHAGPSHTNQRLELRSGGHYKLTTYTDKVREGQTTTGKYKFAGEWHLTLLPDRGEPFDLYRVDYSGEQYWVPANERDGVKDPSGSLLRQNALRVDE